MPGADDAVSIEVAVPEGSADVGAGVVEDVDLAVFEADGEFAAAGGELAKVAFRERGRVADGDPGHGSLCHRPGFHPVRLACNRMMGMDLRAIGKILEKRVRGFGWRCHSI